MKAHKREAMLLSFLVGFALTFAVLSCNEPEKEAKPKKSPSIGQTQGN